MKAKIKILLSIIAFIAFVGVSQAQVTNVGDFRIANATTAFGKNLPVGTKVYNIATGDYWVATTGVASTATLTTASGSFTKLNDSGTDNQNLTYDAANHEIDITGGTSAVIPLAQSDGATEGLASFTANDFNTSNGNVSIDYTNAQKATNSQPGFMTATHVQNIETNNAKVSNVSTSLSLGTVNGTSVGITSDGGANDVILPSANGTDAGLLSAAKFNEITANTAKVSNVSTTLSVGTKSSTTMGITSDGGTDDVILPAATTSDAGLMTASDKSKLNGIQAGAEANLTSVTETFEEDDGTPTSHALGHTAVTAQGCRVSLNGATLSPADYTLTSGTITLDGPVMQYDQVVITYYY